MEVTVREGSGVDGGACSMFAEDEHPKVGLELFHIAQLCAWLGPCSTVLLQRSRMSAQLLGGAGLPETNIKITTLNAQVRDSVTSIGNVIRSGNVIGPLDELIALRPLNHGAILNVDSAPCSGLI